MPKLGDLYPRLRGTEVGAMDLAPQAPPAPPSPAERAAMDADLCRWADRDGPCGCQPDGPPRICSHPSRPREVRRPDCLHCVTLPDWHGR